MATFALMGLSITHPVAAQASFGIACDEQNESFEVDSFGMIYYTCAAPGGNYYNCVFDLHTGAGYCGD